MRFLIQCVKLYSFIRITYIKRKEIKKYLFFGNKKRNRSVQEITETLLCIIS